MAYDRKEWIRLNEFSAAFPQIIVLNFHKKNRIFHKTVSVLEYLQHKSLLLSSEMSDKPVKV